MSVRVNKSSFNIREKLSELEKPIGLKGSELMRAETAQEARNLVSAGRKNLVINGAMQVAQRGTVVNAGNEYAGPDRMRFSKNDGAFTISQSTDVPSGQGFGNSWKCDVTSVAGTAGSYYVILEHRIEGQNLQMLKKGTASAENFTVQFWIKTSKTGTYIVEMRDTDNNRSISQSYTVSAADTWEKKILTFDGDTSGVLNNDNGSSLTILLWLYAGSTFTSGTLQTSWGAETDANKAIGQVNAADNTANNIYITGLQLEVGKNATEFEHRSYGEELALCQRYYQIPTLIGDYVTVFPGRSTGTTSIGFSVPLSVPLRAAPSLTGSVVDPFYAYSGGARANTSSGTITLNASNAWANYGTSVFLQVGGFSGLTDDRIYNIGGYGSGSKIILDSEL